MIAPSLIGVGLFGFTLSYDEFARTLMTSGTFNTLPLEIYGMTTNVTTPVLYALGTVTTVFSFLVILGDARRHRLSSAAAGARALTDAHPRRQSQHHRLDDRDDRRARRASVAGVRHRDRRRHLDHGAGLDRRLLRRGACRARPAARDRRGERDGAEAGDHRLLRRYRPRRGARHGRASR